MCWDNSCSCGSAQPHCLFESDLSLFPFPFLNLSKKLCALSIVYVYCYENNLCRPAMQRLAGIETLAVLTVRHWSLLALFWPSLWLQAGQSCQVCQQRRQYVKSGTVWRKATEGKGATDPRWVQKKVLKPPFCVVHHAGLKDHISVFHWDHTYEEQEGRGNTISCCSFHRSHLLFTSIWHNTCQYCGKLAVFVISMKLPCDINYY